MKKIKYKELAKYWNYRNKNFEIKVSELLKLLREDEKSSIK